MGADEQVAADMHPLAARVEGVGNPEADGRCELQAQRHAAGPDCHGEGGPGGVGGGGAEDDEESRDWGGGPVGLVPTGGEGRAGGDERVVEVDGCVHGVVVDANVPVGVAVGDVECEAGTGRARVRVEAAGHGEGGDVEARAVRAQAEPDNEDDDGGDEEEAQEEGAEGVGEGCGAAVPGAAGNAAGAAARRGGGRSRSALPCLVHGNQLEYVLTSS